MPKKTATANMTDTVALAAEPELLVATLDVHRQLELRDQLQVIVRQVVDWCAAPWAVALGPGEDARTRRAVACNLDSDDPRLLALRGTRRNEMREWLRGGIRIVDGLGPFATLADPWPGAPPEVTLVLPICGQEGGPEAIVLVFCDEAPPATVLERLGRFVEAVQPAVANAVQVLGIRELVIMDDTAQCFNRRYFESSLPIELSRASRFHAALSLIFLDMDNLKEVNNRHGHAMGSQSLFEVSRRIRGKIRRFDKLFRFGGDEFCIVLPETEWHGALEVAERVRDAIASKPFLIGEISDPAGIRMTASLGIASYPLHARTREELIAYSDRAMQRIKSGTKNSIGIAEIVGGSHGD